jgi:hypothetical protein
MRNLPSEQEEKIKVTIEKFEKDGRIEIEEPCDCGSQIRHNNGGNYHQWIILQKDGEKTFAKFGDTCELKPSPEWEEVDNPQEIIKQNADWL